MKKPTFPILKQNVAVLEGCIQHLDFPELYTSNRFNHLTYKIEH